MKAFRNFFPAAKKLPRKVARRLSVFFCLPLRSLPGAAELAPLKQSSPAFRLLPRSRQPDKGGHFTSPTLPAIKGEGGNPFVIPNEYEESHAICLGFFISLCSIQKDI